MGTRYWKCAALALLATGLLAGCNATTPTRSSGEPAASKVVSGTAVVIPAKVAFRKNINVPTAVRSECQLDTRLPEFIVQYAQDAGVAVLRKSAAPGKGRSLTMEIVNVLGTGGGAWSGPKSVTVEGKLYENGKVIGTFTATRFSGGGAFAGYKGTCSILGRCVKTLGQDIARWLQNPSMGARLGNA